MLDVEYVDIEPYFVSVHTIRLLEMTRLSSKIFYIGTGTLRKKKFGFWQHSSFKVRKFEVTSSEQQLFIGDLFDFLRAYMV